jgi:hypothetical protein
MTLIRSISPDLLIRARLRAMAARLALVFLAIAAALPMGARPASAVTVCYDKGEQDKLVADHEIVPVSTAVNARKAQKRGKLVDAEVCRNQKGFFYKMTMQSDGGEVTLVRVPATPEVAQFNLHAKGNCYYTGRAWKTGTICKLDCAGAQCPRQYCKANGEWQPLARCEASSSCQVFRSC